MSDIESVLIGTQKFVPIEELEWLRAENDKLRAANKVMKKALHEAKSLVEIEHIVSSISSTAKKEYWIPNHNLQIVCDKALREAKELLK